MGEGSGGLRSSRDLRVSDRECGHLPRLEFEVVNQGLLQALLLQVFLVALARPPGTPLPMKADTRS